MRARLVLTLGIFAVSACSEQSAEKSPEAVIAEGRQIERPVPGLYKTTSELREFSVPGLPAAQADMMRQQFAANANTTSTMCLTKEDAEQGFERMVRQMGELQPGVECAFSEFEAAGTQLDAALNCTGPGGMKMATTMNGTVEPEQSDMTMSMKNSSSMMPGVEMTMVMHTASQRIGECPA